MEEIKASMEEHFAQFPIEIETRNIDFHFNKKHLEFPDVIPCWILKCNGKSFYVNHVDCQVPWNTRETPDNPSTKGAIRIKRGKINIDKAGIATIS